MAYNERFDLQIDRFVAGVEAKAQQVFRLLALNIFQQVVLRTPVDTGRARANWNCAIGSAPMAPDPSVPVGASQGASGTPNPENVGPATEHALAKINETIAGLSLGQIVWLTNALPYILRLEYEAWSAQAPAGMVRITINEWQQALADAARRARGAVPT